MGFSKLMFSLLKKAFNILDSHINVSIYTCIENWANKVAIPKYKIKANMDAQYNVCQVEWTLLKQY